MSNFSDMNRMGQDRPIMRVEEDLRSITRNINTVIKDIQSIKSDIAEIKQFIKDREVKKSQEIHKGWFFTY
jgi:uncharacterized protein (UPF0335 family)